jgi:hypothetical protein
MYSPFEEMTWPQFVSQPHLKKLTLQEQADLYNQYMFEISTYQQNWISYQNKGLPPSGNTGSIPSIISYFNYAGFYNETTFVNWTSYSASQAKCAFNNVSITPTTVTSSITYPLIAGTGVRSYTTPTVGVTLYDFYNPSLPYEPAGANQTASIIYGIYGDPNAAVYTLFQGVITDIQLLSSLPACLPTIISFYYTRAQWSESSSVDWTPYSASQAKCAFISASTATASVSGSATYPFLVAPGAWSFIPPTIGVTLYDTYNPSIPYEPAGFNQTASIISGLYGPPSTSVYTLFQGVITDIQLLSSLPACP